MTASIPAPRLSVHRSVLRFVHDRNPFYLLSALCMFVGFRVVLAALNSAPGDWKTLLGLIVTLNVYELVLIALALYLIVDRGLCRDGWILLGIDALFLVDLTNLNAELFTAMPRLGSVVNGCCFLLATGKIVIVTHVLDLRITTGTTIYIAAQFAFLLGLPGLFKSMQSNMSAVSSMQIYSIWWAAGLLMVGGAFLVRREPGRSPMSALPWRLYVLCPLISLLVHLASENRVYWVHFHPANVAPILLAMVVVLNQSKLRYLPGSLGWSFALTMAAVLVSVVPAGYQHELSARVFGFAVSPIRVACIGAGLVLMFVAVRQQSVVAGAAVSVGMMLAGLGTNPTEIAASLRRIVHFWQSALLRLIPETVLAWGYVTIAAAFVLLGVGAAVSLNNRSPRPAEVETAS